jgi:N,N'-diacetyllegionaminate synthase
MIKIKNTKINSKNIFITFEAGATHRGFADAKKLIDIAVKAKADAIKFQIFSKKNFIKDKNLSIKFKILKKNNKLITKKEKLYKIFEKRYLKEKDWIKLKNYADKKKILFFATAGSFVDLNLIKKIKCHSIKIASSDINYLDLIEQASLTGKNIQLDTGNANLDDVKRAIKIIEKNGNKNIILHYCPPGYPTTYSKINLKFIEKLKKLKYPVAFSDHSSGDLMDIAAVCNGVCLIEKTITLNKYTPEIEHCFSLEPNEASKFVKNLKNLKKILNNKKVNFNVNKKFRRGVYLKSDIKKNIKIKEKDVIFARPQIGIGPDDFYFLRNKKLKKDKKKDDFLRKADFLI